MRLKLIKILCPLFTLFIISGCINPWEKKEPIFTTYDKPDAPSIQNQYGVEGEKEGITAEPAGDQSTTLDMDYIVGPEDILKIQVWDNPDLDRTVQVSREGIFSFPFIRTVKADGLSVAQLEEELKNRLADGYLIKPHVTIKVDEYKSKKVFVLGEVHKPGTYPLTGRTDLLDVISQAAGQTSEAGNEAVIIRPQNNLKKEKPTLPQEAKEGEVITIDLYRLLKGDITQNIDLQKGDTIYVPKRSYFYVFGEVRSPGRYVLERETTVLKGITMAGGLTEKAGVTWRIRILRKKDGKKLELKAMMDQLLEPEDIISVPESFF